MLRAMIFMALLAALGRAQETPGGAGIDYGAADWRICDPPRIVRAEASGPTACVRIREGGLVQIKAGADWHDATLDGVGTFFRGFADVQDAELRRSGKSAYERGGSKVPRLFVSIEAEPTVPWQHVQWLMVVACENKYYKFQLSDGTRRWLIFLAPDLWVEDIDGPLLTRINAIVHVVARKEKLGKWGAAEVARPTEVLYKFSSEPVDLRYKTDEEMRDLGPVVDWIAKAKRIGESEKDTVVIGQLKAGYKVPISSVLDALEAFEKAQLMRVEFYGAAFPPPGVRNLERLPYPRSNYPNVGD